MKKLSSVMLPDHKVSFVIFFSLFESCLAGLCKTKRISVKLGLRMRNHHKKMHKRKKRQSGNSTVELILTPKTSNNEAW